MKKKEAKKRKRRLLIAALAVVGVTICGLTYAWLTSTDSVTNTFKASGNFKTTVVENFTPPTNWQPGTTTDKVVQITNTGTVDAYTRVQLNPTLSYYKEDSTSTVVIESGKTYNKTDSKSYVPADATAIDAVAANANKTAATEGTGLWKKFEGGTSGLTVKDQTDEFTSINGMEIPANVTVWVKASQGDSTTSDSTVETGYNYEFMAYYTYTETDESTGSTKTEVYAVTVTDPNYTQNTSGNITHTMSNAADLQYTLKSTTKYTYSATDNLSSIKDMITINFYNDGKIGGSDATDGALDTDDWYHTGTDVYDGYYYYKHVLTSGTTTTPLIESVTFNSTFSDTVYDAQFDLNVVNDSSQAIYEAALATFGSDATTRPDSTITKLDDVKAIFEAPVDASPTTSTESTESTSAEE